MKNDQKRCTVNPRQIDLQRQAGYAICPVGVWSKSLWSSEFLFQMEGIRSSVQLHALQIANKLVAGNV